MQATTHSPLRRRTDKNLVLAAGLVLLIGGVILLVRSTGLMAVLNAAILSLREAGPTVFFLSMALLPAVGFPLLAFTLAAGPVFGPVLGVGWVIAWSLAAVLANLLLTYWLTNRALRPLVRGLLAWFDFRLPESAAGDAWQTTLIVRLTPGPPFWAQSYLLGLIRVPLAPYLMVSMLVMAGYIVALVCGGEAIVSGNGRLAIAAVGVLVVSVAGLQLLRRHTARHRAVSALLLMRNKIVPAK